MSTDIMTIKRPDGLTDGRWAAYQNLAQLIITGHTPWCVDHHGEGDDGWCQQTLTSFCAEVEITNGTTDGRTKIGIYARGDVDLEDLTVEQASAVGSLVTQATHMIRLANVGDGIDQ